MVKIIFKRISLILSVCGLVFLASLFLAENSSAKIENNVSATASTGGNTVTNGGTIKAGNATATASAQNSVNNGEKVQNNVQAKAEVQGAGATASVEANGEKKSCTAENGEGCAVEINQSSDVPDNNSSTESVDKKDENIIQAVASVVSGFVKNIASDIASWFS
jgi:hypothetical protein